MDEQILTLDDFAKQIVEPMVQALEKKLGKSRKELLKQFDRELEPHRRLMEQVRREAGGDGAGSHG